MALDLDTVKLQRLQTRRSLDTLIHEVQNLWDNRDANPPSSADLRMLGNRLSKHEEIHESLCSQIEVLLSTTDEKQTDFSATSQMRDNVWDTHTKLHIMLEIAIGATASTSPPPHRSPSPSASVSTRSEHKRAKLPQITIPKFSGDPMQYREFLDTFDSIIDSNDDLRPVDKLHYLKRYVSGEAFHVIQGYRVTNENYAKARESLKDRFGDPELAKFGYLDSFIKIPPAGEDIASVRTMFDNCVQHIRSLEALGYEEEHFGMIFTTIIVNKLPENLLVSITRQRDASGSAVWNLALLQKLLREEIQSRSFAQWSIGVRNAAPASNHGTSSPKAGNPRRFTPRPPTTGAFANAARPLKCTYCQGPHYSDQCRKLGTYEERHSFVRTHKLCIRCLSSDHFAASCQRVVKCAHCHSEDHHRSLCRRSFAKAEPSRPRTEAKMNPTTFVAPSVNHNATSAIHMQMALIRFPGTDLTARVFFDNGSSCSFVTSALARTLGLPPFDNVTVSNARFEDCQRRTKTYPKVHVPLHCLNGEVVSITALVTDLISCPVQKQSVDIDQFRIFKEIRLADPPSPTPQNVVIDILIGSDHYFDLVESEHIRLGNGLVLVGSKLGYLTAGRSDSPGSAQQTFLTSLLAIGDDSLPTLSRIEKFWMLEDIGIKDDFSQKDDELALQQFQDTVSFAKGRYEVGWLWKPGHPDLPDNYKLSFARLKQTVRGLRNQPEILQAYDSDIRTKCRQSIIEVVDPSKPTENLVHYLPHRAVVRPDRPTTQIRVVHDASAKAGRHLPSLNDCMFRGPIFLSDLAGLLLRFRMKPVAVISDIEKAFLQISLREQDRDVTRFLWPKDISQPISPRNLEVYRFSRILFGVICCPSLLGCVLNYHLSQQTSTWAQQLLNDHFVDNVVTGFECMSDASSFYTECKRLLADISMNLRQWHSNSPGFLASLPASDLCNPGPAKVLGMVWNPTVDVLSCVDPKADQQQVVTKRDLLAATSRLFDPLGLFSPIVIRPKLLVQQTWKQKLQWDAPLPPDILNLWQQYATDLQHVSKISVPRFIRTAGANEQWQLHCFCDASGKAYAAVVYLRCAFTNPPYCRLLFSKAKLAPTKPITLPRLELMAVVLGVRILKFVATHLKLFCHDTFVWTDSKCTLHWIQSAKVLTVFVANRVREIRSYPITQFRYVPTEQNPADLPSRGSSALDLESSSLWWDAPGFLALQSDNWPSATLTGCANFSNEIVSHSASLLTPGQQDPPVGPAGIDASNFSDLHKLLRVTSMVLRFLAKLRRKSVRPWLSPMVVPAPEYTQALHVWISHVQQFMTPPKGTTRRQQFENMLRQLCVEADASGILRCKGRLERSELVGDATFPILLPPNHAFTRLAILDAHIRVQHSKHLQTLAELRQRFWVPSGAQTVQRVLRSCQGCRLWEGGAYPTPPFPPLPSFRSSQSEVFTHTGLDYVGPLWVSNPSQAATKCWICLFTCAATRALHLEVVPDMSTHQFLLSFRRFVALYGSPKLIICDNAKQFKLAENVLARVWSEACLDHSVQEFSAKNGITWKFIPEYAPWMGGFYERLVGSVKRSLNNVLGRISVNLMQLQTVVAEVASTLNRRPLVFSGDLNDPILTPSHLMGKFRHDSVPLLDCPEDDPDFVLRPTKAEDLVKMWKSTSALVGQFWDVWSRMYLASLRESCYKGKGHARASQSPQVGDVVLVHEKNVPRCLWKVGKIEELIPSSDGIHRAAKVLVFTRKSPHTGSQKLIHHVVTRAIAHLYPIESSAQDAVDKTGSLSLNQQKDEPPPKLSVQPHAPAGDAESEDELEY